MKKVLAISTVFILPLLFILLLATASPAVAAKGGKHAFNIAGSVVTTTLGTVPISATENVTGTVTVHVVLANKIAKTYMGDDLDISVTTATVILLKGKGGPKLITLADLTPDMVVRVKGSVVDDEFIAKRIVANSNLPHHPPKPPKPPKNK